MIRFRSSAETETWPRWLPAPNLRDQELHFVYRRGEKKGACGQPVMWVEVGHPTTKRPRCGQCTSIVRQAGHA